MKPDVIVAWPRHADYPLWRAFIRDERERFGQVIVAFTEHTGYDYRPFIVANLPDVRLIDVPVSANDWRDDAVNAALDVSDAEWVWFTEQDFLIADPPTFFPHLIAIAGANGAAGWFDHYRWHPSCLLVHRERIEATSRYFGPVPFDHFARFSAELGPVGDIGPEGWEHLAGLSHNHWLHESTGTLDTPGIYERERFVRYLADCLAADVALDPHWATIARGGIRWPRSRMLSTP